MKREVVRRMSHAGLFFLGLIIGGFGIIPLKNTPILQSVAKATTQHFQSPTRGNLSTSCSPQEQTDDIFFISCGGIY